MHIGIDLMGSDCAPSLLFKAIFQFLHESMDLSFTLFLTQHALDSILLDYPVILQEYSARLIFHTVKEIIEMSEEPLKSFSKKKESSLAIGLKFLKNQQVDAFISAGNTGALIAGASLTLGLLEGISRPALLTSLPTEKGHIVVVDVGGNVTYKAFHLVQYAQLGAAYHYCQNNTSLARIGLLNIGVESKKGTLETQRAYQLLEVLSNQRQFEFIGNIEGRAVFQGHADVLVTDGFTGNVLLKASEGVYRFILQKIKFLLQDFSVEQQAHIYEKLNQYFDYEEYAGAIVSGVDRLVIKCHGQSSQKGLYRAIIGAKQMIENQFMEKFSQRLDSYKK